MRINNRCFLAFVATLCLGACASPGIAPESRTLSAEVLLRASPLTGGTDVPELPDIDVLRVNAAMQAFLDEHVDRENGRTLKVHDLVYAIISEGSFGLEYDEITRTADETFDTRLGNCLSFTNMFVAMAREVGIEAAYQEIEIPPSWSQEGGVYILSRHVNIAVDLGGGAMREVDFNIDDFQSSYDRRPISDERALAHYYSNVGAEHLQENELPEALRYFRKALDSDKDFAPAWSNLGALYSLAGLFDYAEAAYVKALQINPREAVAMSNLGQLYEYLGKVELANWYNALTDRHRQRNPYYRYHLAHDAFLTKDYETAIDNLKYAVRKKKNEDTFYFLMGLSYLKNGNEPAARRWLKKAQQVAQDDGLKRNYHSKLEKLLDTR